MTPPPSASAEYTLAGVYPERPSLAKKSKGPDLIAEGVRSVYLNSFVRKSKIPIPFWAVLFGGARVHLSLCEFVKRVLDAIGATALIVISVPLLLLVAVVVKVSSPGPVLFSQMRVGLNGRKFVMYKFRTMVDGAESMKAGLAKRNEAGKILFKMRNDPRVTEIGRIMRRASLDELPQLWNVLRGEMSLVGPRPPVPSEVVKYTPKMLERLSVRPGMTGLWQVSGRSEIPCRRGFALDIWYTQQKSLTLDLAILVNTIPAVLLRRGAF